MGSSCHDIMMILAGGIVGLLSSLIILSIQIWINNKGNVKIYRKIIAIPFQNNDYGWGCIEERDELVFMVPMAIELMNTSNTTKVIRDLSLHLYEGMNYVGRMIQIEYSKGKTDIEYGADNNAYSFTLAPRSVQKQRCLFAYKIHKSQRRAVLFDTIKIQYYDEKDRPHKSQLVDGIVNCWGTNLYEKDENWTLLSNQ